MHSILANYTPAEVTLFANLLHNPFVENAIEASIPTALPTLFGMSFYTFENYLEDVHHIKFSRKYSGGQRAFIKTNGTIYPVVQYADDAFGTLHSLVVKKLREGYPEGNSFPSVEAGRTGDSPDFKRQRDAFNKEYFESSVLTALTARASYDDDVSRYNDAVLIVSRFTPAESEDRDKKHLWGSFYNAIAAIFIRLRSDAAPIPRPSHLSRRLFIVHHLR